VPELRIDPLSGDKVLIAADRALRPGGSFHLVPPAPLDHLRDPFAPGHEDQTPPEVDAVRDRDGAWTVRVVPNRYPALRPDAPDPPRTHAPDLYGARAARGHHEVIVNSPDGLRSLGDLGVEQLALAMDVWRRRIRAHAETAAYVHVAVNERSAAGASLGHTHAQVFALPFVPAVVARERERFTAYATRTMGANLLADLLQEEVRQRERIVAVDAEAVLLAPFASRTPYQMMLVPRTPRPRFEDDGPLGAALLHDAVQRLRRVLGASPPLNLWVRTAPRGAEHFCWRIDVWPHLTHHAGLELGTGVHINIVAPEQAAADLRAA
jgi:UDPglucose--hexose-1-phosphate uridylyltransferase